jgi:hypothetical protein
MQLPSKRSFIFTLALVIFLIGCTPPQVAQRISAFATATTDVSENVADAFRRVGESYIATATEEAVEKISKGEKVNPKEVVKPFLDNNEYEARATILRGLSNYATLLAQIMGDSPQKDLDANVDKLAASLKNLSSDKTLQGKLGGKSALTNEDVGILATGINEIAKLVIDYKRTKDVKIVIGEADEHIQKICYLLQKDIGEKRDVPGLRSQLYITYDKRIQDRFDWIATNSKPNGGSKPIFSPLEQRAEIYTWLGMVQDQEKSDGTMERIYQSLGTLRLAHSKLLTAFNDSAPELDEQIALLKSEAERVRNRYGELKK